jgi:ArsR family transcriptional regulator
MGEEVEDELENLIEEYNQATAHAEDLLKQINERKKALKKRTLNLPVVAPDESTE